MTETAVLASSPVVGSSRNSTCGSMMSSIPMLVLFLSPPDTPRRNSFPIYTFNSSHIDKATLRRERDRGTPWCLHTLSAPVHWWPSPLSPSSGCGSCEMEDGERRRNESSHGLSVCPSLCHPDQIKMIEKEQDHDNYCNTYRHAFDLSIDGERCQCWRSFKLAYNNIVAIVCIHKNCIELDGITNVF